MATIQTHLTPQPVFVASRQPEPTPPPSPEPQDKLEQGPPDPEPGNVWKALRAIPSSLAGAVICGVGVGAASLVDVPRVTVSAARSLWHTPKIGRNLKVMTGLLLPVAAAASLVLSPIAGALYGLVTGFANGAEKGVADAVKSAAKDVGRYHNEVAGEAVKWLKDEQTANLPEGQEPYDVSVLGAGKGLVGGAISGTITGVAATALAAGYAIPGAVRAEVELWKSDIPVPFKIVGTPVVPIAVGLAACLAPAAGVLYGLGMGARDSYKEGIGEAIGNSAEAVKKANSALCEAIF